MDSIGFKPAKFFRCHQERKARRLPATVSEKVARNRSRQGKEAEVANEIMSPGPPPLHQIEKGAKMRLRVSGLLGKSAWKELNKSPPPASCRPGIPLPRILHATLPADCPIRNEIEIPAEHLRVSGIRNRAQVTPRF